MRSARERCHLRDFWVFLITYFHSLILQQFNDKPRLSRLAKLCFKLTNTICVIHGEIQTGSKTYLSLSVDYRSYFFRNKVPWGPPWHLALYTVIRAMLWRSTHWSKSPGRQTSEAPPCLTTKSFDVTHRHAQAMNGNTYTHLTSCIQHPTYTHHLQQDKKSHRPISKPFHFSSTLKVAAIQSNLISHMLSPQHVFHSLCIKCLGK